MSESPSRSFEVKVDVGEEHHMSARDVLLIPSQPIRGIATFKTTNGNAAVAGDPPLALLWDSTTILIYDPARDDLRHVRPTSGRYFTRVRVEDHVLRADYYGTNVTRESMADLPLDDLSLLPEGFGPVLDGQFPSAFPRTIEEQPSPPPTQRPRRRDDPLTKRQRRQLEAMERFGKRTST